MSILYPDSLPRSVEVDGQEYAIRWQYYIILEILRLFDDEDLDIEEAVAIALDLFYVNEIPRDIMKAFQAMQEFIDRASWNNGYRGKPQKTTERLFDWELDAPFIWASFRQVYGGWDWSNSHWWEFKAAFDGLPDNCKIREVIAIRARKVDPKMSAKEKEAIWESKRFYALPKKKAKGARTAQEIERELLERVQKNGG